MSKLSRFIHFFTTDGRGSEPTGILKTAGPFAVVHVTDALAKAVADLTVAIEPVQSGSGDPSPNNVRPISGWTGADIWDDPRYGGLINWNQYLKELNSSNYEASNSRGTADFTDGVAKYVITEVSSYAYGNRLSTKYSFTGYAHKYYAAFTHRESKLGLRVMLTYVASSVGAFDDSSLSWQRSEGIGTISQGDAGSGKWLAFRLQDGTGTGAATRAVGDWMEVKDALFIDLTQMFGAGNEPSTVEEFKALFPNDSYAYNTGTETVVGAVNGEDYRHIEVSWQSEAGTVYGGTLDVTTGVLTVDRGIQIFTGTENWQKYNDANPNGTYFGLSGTTPFVPFAQDTHAVCSMNKRSTRTGLLVGDGFYWLSDGWRILYGATGGAETLESFKSYLAGLYSAETPAAICGMLASPVSYQLTPVEIKTLLGENNIWSDTGDVTLQYYANA